MAKTHHTRSTPTRQQKSQKSERTLTVGLYPEINSKKPFIRLQGLWLAKAGFIPGSKIKVIVENNVLVLLPHKHIPLP